MVFKRTEVALPVQTKAFLWPITDTTMLFSPFRSTHTPPPVSSLLLTQNVISPKDRKGLRLRDTRARAVRNVCIVWDYAIKKLPSCPAPCDSAPPPPESSCSGSSYQRFLLKYTFPNTFRTARARVSCNLNAERNQVGMQTILSSFNLQVLGWN